MSANDKIYDILLSELEEIDPDFLTTEEKIARIDGETIAEVLAGAMIDAFTERIEELFNTIEMEFTAIKEESL